MADMVETPPPGSAGSTGSHGSPRGERRDPRLVTLAEDSGYEILGRIGAGGMGIVYRAFDADDHEVAIKLLRHEISDDPRARERLSREVAAQKLVRSDNIVRILDAELDSSDAFVVTEFVPGPTLEDAVRTQGGLHPEAVREIGLVMGDALNAIHRSGVIHRDLKPSNVLLRGADEEDLTGFDPDGDRLDPVIIDFGIAIAAEESRLTSTGLVMGTAAYLDPEVIRTDHTGEAGDWWAWAALLAFAATGREPFGSGRADLVFLRAERGEIDVDGLPVELAAWLRSALQSEPSQRPAPEDLLARLTELDLSRYEDAGPTEALNTDGSTAALPVTGAGGAAGEDTDAVGTAATNAGAGAGAAGAAAAGAVGAASAAAADGPGTGAVDPRPPHSHEAIGDEPPTEALAPITSPDEAPTQALPRVGTPDEPPTEALSLGGSGYDAEDAPTEALPVMGPPTRQMPVVPPSAPPPPEQTGGFGVTSQYPVQRAPQQYAADPRQAAHYPAPGQTVAQPAQHPAYDPSALQQGPPPGYPVQGGGQMAPMQQGWPAPAPRPPRRPVLVWLGHLLIIALAALAPYVSLIAFVLLGTLARTWERSHRRIADRRMRGSTGSGPLWAAGLISPFAALLGLLEIVLQAIFPLILGVLVGIAIDAGWTLLEGSAPPDGVAFGAAMAVTLLITWVGLGSRTTRNGAHRMVDAAAPDRVWTSVVLVLLLALVGAVVFTLLAREGMVDYFPFPSGPRLEDIAIWRR